MQIKNASIVDATEQYIVNPCNSKSVQAGAITHQIFERFPYSNVYIKRSIYNAPIGSEMPGNILVYGNGSENRFVINAFIQYFPAQPNHPKGLLDGFQAREKYFYTCLQKICAFSNVQSIAFPYLIGSGLAGGNWQNYFKMLSEFASAMSYAGAKISLYRSDSA